MYSFEALGQLWLTACRSLRNKNIGAVRITVESRYVKLSLLEISVKSIFV